MSLVVETKVQANKSRHRTSKFTVYFNETFEPINQRWLGEMVYLHGYTHWFGIHENLKNMKSIIKQEEGARRRKFFKVAATQNCITFGSVECKLQLTNTRLSRHCRIPIHLSKKCTCNLIILNTVRSLSSRFEKKNIDTKSKKVSNTKKSFFEKSIKEFQTNTFLLFWSTQ